MRLRQGQMWKIPDFYVRIVRLERLEVEYKATVEPHTKEGSTHTVTKKQFCRLIKNAELVDDNTRAGFEKVSLKVDKPLGRSAAVGSHRGTRLPFKPNRRGPRGPGTQ